MAAPSDQQYPSLNKYLKYNMARCSSNHGHTSSKCMLLCLGNGCSGFSVPVNIGHETMNIMNKHVEMLTFKITMFASFPI